MNKLMQRGSKHAIFKMIVVLLALNILNVVVGSSGTPDFAKVLTALRMGPFFPNDSDSVILWEIRLPRTLAACFSGALLGTVGAVYQAIFRNVLAEPYLVGVSGGAALGGSIAIAFGIGGVFGFGAVGLAVIGGIVALIFAVSMGKVRGQIDSQRLLISGLVIGAIFSSGMTLVLSLSGRDTNRILRWLFGSLTPMFWPSVALLFGAFLVQIWFALKHSRAISSFAVSREQTYSVGFDPDKVVKEALAVGAICTSAVVGVIGMVGFLGLIAPNLARILEKSDYRKQVVLSGFIGASLLLCADLISQRTGELPIGAITAVFGGIALLLLFGRRTL